MKAVMTIFFAVSMISASFGKGTAPSVDRALDLVRQYRASHPRYLQDRRDILEDLRDLGPGAAPAIPMLIEILTDTAGNSDRALEFRTLVRRVLIAIGKPAVPAVVALLDRKGTGIVFRVSDVLCGIGEPAVTELAQALAHEHPTVRNRAALILRNLGIKAAPAVPALVQRLNDDVDSVARSASVALGKIGDPAVPQLLQALKHPRPNVRKGAAGALGLMESPLDSETIVRALAAASADPIGEVRHAVGMTLGRYGQRSSVPILMEILRDDLTEWPAEAAELLDRLGESDTVLRALREDLDSGTVRDRRNAASALSALGAQAVPLLTAALRDDATAVRTEAVWSLKSIGDPARTALSDLSDMLTAPDMNLNDAAVETILFLSHHQHDTISLAALVAVARHGPPLKRGRAVYELAAWGADAVPALPRLLQAARDGDERLQEDVMRAFERIGEASIEFLAGTVQDPDPRVRCTAFRLLEAVLERREEGSMRVVAVLFSALGDSDPQVVSSAGRALSRLAGSPHYVPAWVQALRDPDDAVRIGASAWPVIRVRADRRTVTAADTPALIAAFVKVLGDRLWIVRLNAAHFLIQHEWRLPRAVSALVRLTESKHADCRRRALMALYESCQPVRLGHIKSQRPAWFGKTAQLHVRALKDEDTNIRLTAAGNLIRLDTHLEAAVQTLVALWQSGPPDIRHHAVMELSKSGAGANIEIHDLVSMLKDPDWRVREWAARVLIERGRLFGAVCETARDLLSEKPVAAKLAALRLLQSIGTRSDSAVAILMAALNDTSWEVRGAAARAVGTIGLKGDRTVPRLIQLLDDDARHVRGHAARSLVLLGQDAMPAVINALRGISAHLRGAAAGVLADMKAVQPLIDLFIAEPEFVVYRYVLGPLYLTQKSYSFDKDSYEEREELLYVTLAGLGDTALAGLRRFLKSRDARVRRSVILVLAYMGAGAAAEKSTLIEALVDRDTAVRRAAAVALNRMGDTDRVPYTFWFDALSDTREPIRREAEQSLLSRSYAVDDLIASLERPEPHVKAVVSRILANMGDSAAPAIPALIRCLGADRADVRGAASWALAHIGGQDGPKGAASHARPDPRPEGRIQRRPVPCGARIG